MHCLHTSNTTLFNLHTIHFSCVWFTRTTFALLIHAEAKEQQKAWSNGRVLQLPSLFVRELSDCQVMTENASEQCSLGHKENNYTNLTVNKISLRGITSFCGTEICSFHFWHAEVHQKRPRIARPVLLTWTGTLDNFWLCSEIQESNLPLLCSPSSPRTPAGSLHISRECTGWPKFWNIHQ